MKSKTRKEKPQSYKDFVSSLVIGIIDLLCAVAMMYCAITDFIKDKFGLGVMCVIVFVVDLLLGIGNIYVAKMHRHDYLKGLTTNDTTKTE